MQKPYRIRKSIKNMCIEIFFDWHEGLSTQCLNKINLWENHWAELVLTKRHNLHISQVQSLQFNSVFIFLQFWLYRPHSHLKQVPLCSDHHLCLEHLVHQPYLEVICAVLPTWFQAAYKAGCQDCSCFGSIGGSHFGSVQKSSSLTDFSKSCQFLSDFI